MFVLESTAWLRAKKCNGRKALWSRCQQLQLYRGNVQFCSGSLVSRSHSLSEWKELSKLPVGQNMINSGISMMATYLHNVIRLASVARLNTPSGHRWIKWACFIYIDIILFIHHVRKQAGSSAAITVWALNTLVRKSPLRSAEEKHERSTLCDQCQTEVLSSSIRVKQATRRAWSQHRKHPVMLTFGLPKQNWRKKETWWDWKK